MNVKSSGLYEKDVSADTPSAVIGTMDEEEDDGKIVALAKGGVTGLARTAGRTSLAREVGGISLVRTALKATQASLLCHHQGGMKTSIRTRGLEASRNRVLSLASWAVPRPRPLSASSSSLLTR